MITLSFLVVLIATSLIKRQHILIQFLVIVIASPLCFLFFLIRHGLVENTKDHLISCSKKIIKTCCLFSRELMWIALCIDKVQFPRRRLVLDLQKVLVPLQCFHELFFSFGFECETTNKPWFIWKIFHKKMSHKDRKQL